MRSFAISSALIDEMERFNLLDAQQMVETLVAGCRRGGLAPIKDHSFALTLLDGLSSREEVVLAALGARSARSRISVARPATTGT